MKKLIPTVALSFTILVFGCKKERLVSNENIKILTSKSEYIINSPIEVNIKNELNNQASYFKCDNVDLGPSKILKYENGLWVESDFEMVCSPNEPMGYIGLFEISETKHDTLSLYNEMGKFKLRYRFVVGNDTLDFDSNEFLIKGLEL